MKLAGWLILILALLLAAIFGLIDFAAIFHTLVTHPHIALECFILVSLSYAVVALRLAALLKLVDIPITYSDSLKITMLSQFSGTILAGPIGAEATRFGMLMKKCEHRYTELTSALLLDRIFGLSGLMCFVLFMPFIATKISARIPYHYYMTATFLTFSLVLAMLFLGHKYFPTRIKHLTKELIRYRAQGIYKVLSHLGRVFRTAKNIMSNPFTLFKLVGFSIIASILPLIGFSEIIRVFLPNVFNFPSSIMILAITILINSIGITPGGIGVGEGVFALFCFSVTRDGSLPYIETFLTIRLVTIMCALPGGILLLKAPLPEKTSS